MKNSRKNYCRNHWNIMHEFLEEPLEGILSEIFNGIPDKIIWMSLWRNTCTNYGKILWKSLLRNHWRNIRKNPGSNYCIYRKISKRSPEEISRGIHGIYWGILAKFFKEINKRIFRKFFNVLLSFFINLLRI